MKQFRSHQRDAFDYLFPNLRQLGGQGYLAAPGLGKTGVALRLVSAMACIEGVRRVLVVSPEKVLRHWQREATEWGCALPVELLKSTPAARNRQLAENRAGIYGLSLDSVHRTELLDHDWDMFVVDESSKYKNWTARRTKGARRIAAKTPYALLLTGSPAPNCPSEFFAQQFLLDKGRTLGATVGAFRDRFMRRGGFENREWLFNYESLPHLNQLLSPWYLRQDKSVLPPEDGRNVHYIELEVELLPSIKKYYREIEKDLFTEFQGQHHYVFSGSQKYNRCRQITSGRFYDENRCVVELHDQKIKRLLDLVEESPEPVLCAYQYSHEIEAIRRIARRKVPTIDGQTSAEETQRLIDEFQLGIHPLLCGQADALSHGTDGLQHGSSMLVWLTLTDTPDTHDQMNCRLDRTGQTKPVTIFYLISPGTLDRPILRKLQRRATEQEAMIDHFKANYTHSLAS